MYILIITGTSINFDFLQFIYSYFAQYGSGGMTGLCASYIAIILIWLQQGKLNNSSYERGGIDLDN